MSGLWVYEGVGDESSVYTPFFPFFPPSPCPMSVRVHIEEEAAERGVEKRKEREEKIVKIRVTAYRVSFINSIHPY